MLVNGLNDLSLSEMVSGDGEYCSSLHSQLCKCAWEMLAKYKQQEPGKKLTIKTEATKKLLYALCEAPKGQRETRQAISSALKRHAEALQGYEHLLSKKGNTYALVKQTQALRDSHDYASVSLLRYHQLKDKFLRLGTFLSDEQEKVLPELVKKKDLTLKMLEAIDKDFLYCIALKQTKLSASVMVMLILMGQLKPEMLELKSSGIPDTSRASANIPESISIDIKNTMKKAGYHPDEKGMCYGIAWAALLACVRQDGQAYMKRMQYLKHMCIPPLHRADEYQVYPFFDAVTLSQANYQNMSGYSKGIGHAALQEVAFPGSIIVSHRPGYDLVPVVKHVFISECTPETFIRFLQQTRENNNGIPFGVMILYPDHATSIGFDGNKWLAVNHDSYYYTETTELLHTFLDKQGHRHKNGRIIATISVVASKEHSITINKNTIVVDTKRSVFIPVVLHLALYCGDDNVTNDCITLIGQQAHTPETLFEQLTCKDAGGMPGFFMACQNGHSDTIAVFIKKSAAVIARLPLSETDMKKWLCELFASKITDGTPGLCMALNNSHVEVTTTFIQECAAVIAILPLSKKQKTELIHELLACKMDNGIPGFYLPFRTDCPEVITAFIKASAVAAATLSDSEEEKAGLLYSLFHCIENENKLLFLLLIEKASSAVKKAFTEGIDQLPLSDEQKKALKCLPPDPVEEMDISWECCEPEKYDHKVTIDA